MNRLVSVFLAIFAIAFSAGAFAQKTAKGNCGGTVEQCAGKSSAGQVGAASPTNAHLRNLLPQDLVYVDRTKPTYPCADDGAPGTPSGYCSNVVSQGSGQRYVLRFSKNGDSAFVVREGRLVKYAAFNGGTDSAAVAYLSPEARQYAESHGLRHDPRSNTIVAMNAPKETPRVIDCKSSYLNMSDRLACTNGTANQGVVATKAPAPQVAQRGPCDGKADFEKEICIAKEAFKAGALKR